jgi:hypothetical protein
MKRFGSTAWNSGRSEGKGSFSTESRTNTEDEALIELVRAERMFLANRKEVTHQTNASAKLGVARIPQAGHLHYHIARPGERHNRAGKLCMAKALSTARRRGRSRHNELTGR